MTRLDWNTSESDPEVRFREDDYSLQFSAVGNDHVFLRFDKGARKGEVWITDLHFGPETEQIIVNAFDVAAAKFNTSVAGRIIRMTSIAPQSENHDKVIIAFDRHREKLTTIVAALGRKYDDCYLDTSRPSKFDLVMKVL